MCVPIKIINQKVEQKKTLSDVQNVKILSDAFNIMKLPEEIQQGRVDVEFGKLGIQGE